MKYYPSFEGKYLNNYMFRDLRWRFWIVQYSCGRFSIHHNFLCYN